MNYTLAVSVIKSLASLFEIVQGHRKRYRAQLRQDFGQIVAGYIFHYQVMKAVVLTGVVGVHDVGVSQFGGDFDFLVEPSHSFFGFQYRDGQNFDRN